MTLHELYTLYRKMGRAYGGPHAVLCQTDWFSSVIRFDPTTGYPMPMALSEFLRNCCFPSEKAEQKGILKDRVWRIVEHARDSFSRLIRELNENPQRRHESMPTFQAKEFDVGCFIKLAGRPGRTFREKLAAKPHVQGVKRFQSVDLQENRLLKACAMKVLACLDLRHDILEEPADPLADVLRHWLRSDECQQISRWDNTPPNNTLLSHRDYRRVLNAWRWLQTLEADLDNDIRYVKRRQAIMDFWCEMASIWKSADSLVVDQPLSFEYNHQFSILTWEAGPIEFAFGTNRYVVCPGDALPDVETDKVRAIPHEFQIALPSCVDLTEISPQICFDGRTRLSLPYRQIWQGWKGKEQRSEISLFNSDAVKLHRDVETVTCLDLFFSRECSPASRDHAAKAFCAKLRSCLKDDTLVWLTPDFRQDFDLEVLRRNLNVLFPCAEPLPRSVAAVFEQIPYSAVSREGFSVAVVDVQDEVVCVTKLEAQYDPRLLKSYPDSRGWVWVKYPEVVLRAHDTRRRMTDVPNLTVVDENGQWTVTGDGRIDWRQLSITTMLEGSRIGKVDKIIRVEASPVRGACKYVVHRGLAGGVPLWSYCLPELAMGNVICEDGMYGEFQLVSRGTRIEPERGKAKEIPIDRTFKMTAGPLATFPLRRGRGQTQFSYNVCLDAPPLKQSTDFKLILKYTYGATDPYSLTFEAVNDPSVKPIKVKWVRNTDVEGEEVGLERLVPEFPAQKSWSELRRYPKKDGAGTNDLLEWIDTKLAHFDLTREITPEMVQHRVDLARESRVEGTMTQEGDRGYLKIIVDGRAVEYGERDFAERFDLNALRQKIKQQGSVPVWLTRLVTRNGRSDVKARDITLSNPFPPSLENRIRTSVLNQRRETLESAAKNRPDNVAKILHSTRFPMSAVWRGGRSLSEAGAPNSFRTLISGVSQEMDNLIARGNVQPPLVDEMRIFLSFLQDNAPTQHALWLEQISGKVRNIRQWLNKQMLGLALGSGRLKWQKQIMSKLLGYVQQGQWMRPCALEILSMAAWRDERLIMSFSYEEIALIASALHAAMREIVGKLYDAQQGKVANKYDTPKSLWRTQCRLLELLLALLCARASSDGRIGKKLSPNGDWGNDIVELLDEITHQASEMGAPLRFYVDLEASPPPQLFGTHPFLYTVRAFLTGDNGAHSIQIRGFDEAQAEDS